MKRCFVISPIGTEGSVIREHADDVFDYIIKPAMDECGIEPFRSDHLQEPGKITDQVFREILTCDLSIAVLTGQNPNVYYELAVAHAASRPVIVLIEKGEPLPFDIRDIRCVPYDLKPRSLFDRVFVNQVIAHVRTIEQCGWKVPSPFGASVIPQGDHEQGGFTFFGLGNDFGNSDNWSDLFRATDRRFEIMGMHLGLWKHSRGFTDLLAKKAADGCAIRIMILHPDHPTLPQMMNESILEVDLDDVRREIQLMTKYFSQTAERNANIGFRQIRRGIMHCQATLTDHCGMFLPYLYSRRRRHCPLWQCKSGSVMYDLLAEEFESLWLANAP